MKRVDSLCLKSAFCLFTCEHVKLIEEYWCFSCNYFFLIYNNNSKSIPVSPESQPHMLVISCPQPHFRLLEAQKDIRKQRLGSGVLGPIQTSNFSCTEPNVAISTWEVRRMNQLGSADLCSGRLYRSIRLGLSDRTAKDRLRFIRRSSHVPNLNVSCWYKRACDWLASCQKGSRAWNGATAKKILPVTYWKHLAHPRCKNLWHSPVT